MKTLAGLILVLLLLVAGCATRHHFADETAYDVWENRTVGAGIAAFDTGLTFVGVSKDGVLTMRYRTNREYLLTGKPGEYLHGEPGQICYKVISVSVEKNSAVLSTIVYSTRPSY